MASKNISHSSNFIALSVEQITEARVTCCKPSIYLKVCHRFLLPSLLFALGTLLSASAMATPIHVLFERDVDGSAGNELAVVSYPDLPSLIGNTSSFTQFTQVDVSSAFSVGGITFDGSSYRVLYERDVDGSAGNELAVVSYPDLPSLIGNTSSFTQFTQVDVSSAFSVGGFDYDFDSGAYRILFERDLDGAAGNELALVTYPTIADLIGNTSTFTQFTQVDVSSAFSVGGFYSDPPENQNVSEPETLSLLVLGLLAMGLDSRVRRRLTI